VTFHLRVAPSLDLLVDALVDVLALPFADPFVPDVVAVPGDGVRAWLIHRLAERLGTPGAGVVANIDFVYPAEVVRRALGDSEASGAWGVGPLTWVIHDLLGTYAATLGQPAGLSRARAIADLFDRYTLHRPAMVTAWGAGRDVDAADQPLAPDHRWQPQLWRLVRDRLGGVSEAERVARASLDLAVGRLEPALPERVVLFGLASMPGPHLRAIGALSRRIDVHVLAPVPSLATWHQLRSLPSDPLHLPLDRRDDPSTHLGKHPLLGSWGRAPREAHLLLLDATREVPSSVVSVGPAVGVLAADTPLLQQVQIALANDSAPTPATRPVLPVHDRSIEWHRCHGVARQVEVLRDAVLHLLQEEEPDGSPRFEPRDIAVLCPDVPALAPFALAAFAGDPDHGVPAVPLRVADRSLRADNPLLDAVAALLSMVDGRLAASSVLAFASLPPVRRRFSLDTDRLERIGTWTRSTNVRWGLDADHRQAYGLPPEVTAHSWRCGLDQLLLGVTMADVGPRRGLGGAVPFGDVEGADVETAGLFADLIDELARAVSALSGPTGPVPWCDAVADAARALFALPDEDGHLWRGLDTALSDLREESELAATSGSQAGPGPIEGGELATLLGERLAARSGRPRFGTGAVTLSSFTAQRGVPHRVVVLIGIDGDLGGTGTAGSDDLTASPACVGDRDPRSESRAQFLDAVLAAGDRLLLFSTGFDVRTNAEVAPSVPLAELMDLVDATACTEDGRPASAAITVQHPRQAWSITAVTPDALRPGPWSFDTGVLRAVSGASSAPATSPAVIAAPDDVEHLSVRDLLTVVRNPVRSLLQGRLGVWLDRRADPLDDLIPVDISALGLWAVGTSLLSARAAAGEHWDEASAAAWLDLHRAIGAVPPLQLGAGSLRTAHEAVAALLDRCDEVYDGADHEARHAVPIDLEVVVDGAASRVTGEIADVAGNTALTVTFSKERPSDILQAWVRACLLSVQMGAPARAGVVSRCASTTATSPLAIAHLVEVDSPDAGRAALEVLVDTYRRARRGILPVMPVTSRALYEGDVPGARAAWTSGFRDGEDADVWLSFVQPGLTFDDLLADEPLADEAGIGWSDHPSRIERWSHRIWGTLAVTARHVTIPDGSTDG
jgi:exodeoxyribonuclease V gamma subunit